MLTHILVHIDASRTLMMWAFLLKTPRSNAKKKKIPKRKNPQTAIKFILYGPKINKGTDRLKKKREIKTVMA